MCFGLLGKIFIEDFWTKFVCVSQLPFGILHASPIVLNYSAQGILVKIFIVLYCVSKRFELPLLGHYTRELVGLTSTPALETYYICYTIVKFSTISLWRMREPSVEQQRRLFSVALWFWVTCRTAFSTWHFLRFISLYASVLTLCDSRPRRNFWPCAESWSGGQCKIGRNKLLLQISFMLSLVVVRLARAVNYCIYLCSRAIPTLPSDI
jgi:hypothetical protein